MFSSTIALSDWLHDVCERQPQAARLLRATEDVRRRCGYYHTLREILQQPFTWTHTADQMAGLVPDLCSCLSELRHLILTGSGSSEYVGHCVRLALQNRLAVNTLAVGGGALLTHPHHALPPERPVLLVSLARSGDSAESVGVVSLLLNTDPSIRHLVLTCNAHGRLATNFQQNAGVRLVSNFKRAVFLGSRPPAAAALEAALKLLEMTAGRVGAISETYLGLRRGPMSYVHADTLVVCFLSPDATVRAYECDLIREINQKNLGMIKVIVGDAVPSDLTRDRDVAIECPGLGEYTVPVVEVTVGQLLGFFRCMREGFRPDSPSENGVINRVVQSFALHFSAELSLRGGQ